MKSLSAAALLVGAAAFLSLAVAQERRGRVAPGMDADLVVLGADPADDVRNFAKVRCTFRNGQPIYTVADRATQARQTEDSGSRASR